MWDANGSNRRVKAFAADAIHAGNRGLNLDHETIQKKADDLLAKMSFEQKLNEIRGKQAAPIDGLYDAGGDEALGIPAFRMVDGPRGARAAGTATAFPVAIARAASFDVNLENEIGQTIGLEIAARGGNVLLAPTINIIRHPCWGRSQESYSEDTFLTGAMGVAFVSGAQNHVLASPKHFALNNLEITRFEMSANIDVRTLHEVYLPHFKRVVQEAGAASVMSAYNKVNGVYCGEHPVLLNDILRDDWGFKGFVESDWFLGTRSTGEAIAAGMDIEMPAAYRFKDDKVLEALADGEITEAHIDRNVGRALYQKIAWDIGNLPRVPDSVVESEVHLRLSQSAAEQSFVLLKNNGVLPLDINARQRIAIVGDLANMANLGDRGSSMVTSANVSTPLDGITNYLQNGLVTWFANDSDLSALTEFDVCIVVAGLTYVEEGEFIPTQQQEAGGEGLARGGDRETLALPDHQLMLIEQAAGKAKSTVVLLEGGSAIAVEPWIQSVDALLMIWYPGCEGGKAIARVLFGEVSPSGKLPVSFATDIDQLMPWNINAMDITHDLLHGYRYLQHEHKTPSFPFGFGLSYTTFSVDGFQVEREQDGFRFLVTVTNTGERTGAEVVQLYVGVSDSSIFRVPLELKAFGKIHLEPGEKVDLELEVTDESLCYFDPEQAWTLEDAKYAFHVGTSSEDLPLNSEWRLSDNEWEPH